MSDSSVTPWTVAHQAPLSIGFLRQGYWNGLPFPSPEDLLDLGLEPESSALAGEFFTTEPPWKLALGFKGDLMKVVFCALLPLFSCDFSIGAQHHKKLTLFLRSLRD